MVTLVANDGVTKYVLTPGEIESYSTVRSLVDLYGSGVVLNLETVSNKTLRMLERGPDPVMLSETFDLVSALYFLGASDETIARWVVYLPHDYHTVLPQVYKDDLWKRESNYPIPWDYYSSDGGDRVYWESITDMLEDVLDAKVDNKLYLYYLLDNRMGNMTARSYLSNLKSEYVAPSKLRKSADELYSYEARKLRHGSKVYEGYYELFGLIRQDADSYNLLPSSLFTRTPEKLGYSLVDMTQHYINRTAKLGQAQPVLQRFLRMWTIARELDPARDLSFQGEVTFDDDMELSTAASQYYEQLLEVLLGIPLVDWLLETFGMQDDELIIEVASEELRTRLSTSGEDVLGAANAQFLTQALPELLQLSVSAAIQEVHVSRL